MRSAERVVFALGALGEARQAAAHAKRADAVAAAGQDLVRIGLVADVPHDPVIWGVEHVMQRDGEFDDAQTSAQMPPGYGHRIDRLGAKLVGNLLESALVELPQVAGVFDLVEQGRFGWDGHQ